MIGAGTMGHGIAQVCALAGLDVTMLDVSDDALARGVSAVASSLDRLVNKDKLNADEKQRALGRIHSTVSYQELQGADLVIEAATENLEIKLRILRSIEAVVRGDTVIATNTSSILITQLAAVLHRPERCIGMHYFNPVPIMELLELIRGLQTSDLAHEQALAFAHAIGKTAITARNSPGFVVNRILCPMINEAIFVLQEGLATAQEIDAGMRLGCNHLRLAGLWSRLPLQVLLPFSSRAAAVGLGLAVVTGLWLFTVRPHEYLDNAAFQFKAGLLLLALGNIAWQHRSPALACSLDDGTLSTGLHLRAGASTLLWCGVLLAGRWIGFL